MLHILRAATALSIAMALLLGCSGDEERDAGSSSPRTTFKRTGKLRPIHSGFRSKQTSSTHIKWLIKRFDGENESLRREALDEVVEIGRPAVNLLESALKHKSPAVREYVCQALGRISRMPGSFMMGKLVALLNDKVLRVRRAACFAIGNIGTSDTAVAKKVFALLSDPDPGMRTYAAECIRKLKYWPAIPALIFNHLAPRKAPKGKAAPKPKGAKGGPVLKGKPGVDPVLAYTDVLRAYAADALAHITHVDYGTNYQMWRKWWIYNQDRYTADWD